MNERITEFEAQCWEPRQYGPAWFNYKKFAELIVRECAKTLWTEECHTSDLAVEEYNRNSRKITQHFGVEE